MLSATRYIKPKTSLFVTLKTSLIYPRITLFAPFVLSWYRHKRSGYNTVGDIVDKTKKEFRKCKNLGEKSCNEVVANLEKLGLNFRKK